MKKLELMIGLIIMIGSISPIYYLDQAETEIVTVDCYDKNYNVIQGVTCEDEVYLDSKLNFLNEYAPIMMMTFLMGIIILIMGLMTSPDKDNENGR